MSDVWRVDFTIVDSPTGIDVGADDPASEVTATATDDADNTDTITSDPLDKAVDSLAPDPPPFIAATAVPEGKIRLDWIASASPDLAYYNIYRDTAPDPTTLVAEGVTGTTWTEPDPLEDGVEYYYRMKSVDDADNIGDYSRRGYRILQRPYQHKPERERSYLADARLVQRMEQPGERARLGR